VELTATFIGVLAGVLALLQGGFPVIFLPLLGIAFLALIPALVIIFRRASQRNPKRPDDAASGLGDEEGVSESEQRRVVHFFGVILAASGLLLALIGVACAPFPTLVGNVVPAASLGIFMGFVGFMMRARRLGGAAVILAMVALLLGVAWSQGIIPGLGPTDRNLPSYEPRDSPKD
jgi:hypothetical protein